MSKFILAFTKKSSNISKPYFDTLYSWGFSGVGADGSFDLSLLNGVEWKRVTNTSISEAENDGFINEVWKTTIVIVSSNGKPVPTDLVLSAENKNFEYPGWIVYISDVSGHTIILRTDAGNLANRIKPWEVGTSTNWWGEMMLIVDGNFSLSNSVFIPNGDKTIYATISGCPAESVNGTYYQMNPITINGERFDQCFTNGIYLLEAKGLGKANDKVIHELDNSLLIEKFKFTSGDWYNSETSKPVPEMVISYFGNWSSGYGGQ